MPYLEKQKALDAANDQSQDQNTQTNDSTDKAFSTMRAHFALKGFTLTRSDERDGKQHYYVGRWGMLRELISIDACETFLTRIGGAA